MAGSMRSSSSSVIGRIEGEDSLVEQIVLIGRSVPASNHADA
ncbi:MAG: hypothetical protein U0744_11870 [Gemmataceae bacterium]